MLRNYIKLAFRNILKSKLFSAINILGMTIGITACLLILLYVVNELSYDRFHPRADRMYQVGLHGKIGGQDVVTASTCPPMAEALVAEVPGVEDATRIAQFWNSQTLRYEDKNFTEEKIFWADSNFFNFFGYRLLEGDPKTVLKEPNSIVLTESIAKKYFGAESPLGKLIIVGGDGTYKVTGVSEDSPANSHFRYKALLSSSTAEHLKSTAWLNNYLYTYFILRENASLDDVESKFTDFVKKYVGPEIEQYVGVTIEEMVKQGGAYGYFTTPVPDIHLTAGVRDNLEPGGDILYVYFFGGIGIFIVVIACINFMNLSTARSAGRAKEVGLRKTFGSLKGQMIGQFLSESVIYSLIAVVLAVVLCYLLLPQFNLLAGKELGMDTFTSGWFIGSAAALVLIVGIVAGSYPAFYLTSFNAVEVLKGKVRSGLKSKGVRSFLVVCQFMLSIFLIIFTAAVYRQIDFLQKRNLGIDKHNVIMLPSAGKLGKNLEAFKNLVQQQSGIVKASYANNVFPGINNTSVYRAGGSEQDHLMSMYYADYDQQDVLRFEMKEGRYFSRDFPSDSTAIVLNETAVKEFGFEKPLEEEVIDFDEDGQKRLRVVGVFKDFNYESLKTQVRPLAIRLIQTSWNLMIRYQDDPQEVVATLEKLWKEYAADVPFEYVFLDDNFDELFRAEQRMGQLFSVFSGLAIFIACLGLFALAAFTAEQRTKEIGIRKAMGASTVGVAVLLSKEFTRLVIIAFVPAALVGWFVVDNWLDGFAYRVALDPLIIIGSGVLAIIIAWLTVSFQSIKAAAANPVDSLRYE